MGGRELSRAALRGVLTLEAGRGDTPILSIDASPEAPYQAVAEVLSLAQNVGLDKLELLGR
jgi:biopolymer transport protein ExbD